MGDPGRCRQHQPARVDEGRSNIVNGWLYLRVPAHRPSPGVGEDAQYRGLESALGKPRTSALILPGR